MIYIVEVIHKLILAFWFPKLIIIRMKLLWVILLHFFYVIGVEVLFYICFRNVHWLVSLINDAIPIVTVEPWMIFNLLEGAYSIYRIILYALVNKVCCFLWIVVPNNICSYCNSCLPCHHLVSYYFFRFTDIWSLSCHAFVANDTKSKVVSCVIMVSIHHYFWRHVSRCPWQLTLIVFLSFEIFIPNTKIYKTQIPIQIENTILWLQISVDDLLLMACL